MSRPPLGRLPDRGDGTVEFRHELRGGVRVAGRISAR
jgi:hypothetical protein